MRYLEPRRISQLFLEHLKKVYETTENYKKDAKWVKLYEEVLSSYGDSFLHISNRKLEMKVNTKRKHDMNYVSVSDLDFYGFYEFIKKLEKNYTIPSFVKDYDPSNISGG